MLRADDNKFLTESGPGTGMGELLRRFWLPVLLSEELPEADGPPKYLRPRRGSRVDAVEPQVRELLQAWPRMPATVIAERIGSEQVSSDRSILEGCRRFIGCKSPALAEKYRGVLPGWKWRT